MNQDFTTVEQWRISKPALHSGGGIVASQHHLASQAGAEVLAAGGNAVDAAVATALALGVVEPWMSGIGGGGCMIVAPADGEPVMIDFTMVAPKAIDLARYRIVEGHGGDLFGWPKVEGDRNLRGYESIGVPGAIEGFGHALEQFGKLSLAEVMEPALRLARAGLAVDWYTTLMITAEAAALREDAAASALYLPNGLPAVSPPAGAPRRLDLSRLAETMERIARGGRRELYEGDLARELVAELNAGGNRMSLDDLAACRARNLPTADLVYRGTRIAAAAGLTAGPSMIEALTALQSRWRARGRRPDADAYLAYAETIAGAFEHRLRTYGHDGARFGAEPGNTTHLSVVDAAGNMVALTNTLLSLFGSKVVLPKLGLPMNNGLVSFDPTPGHPNGLKPGRRPLSNMCPMIAYRDGRPWLAMGGCGGRKIMPAVMQTASFVIDYGMSLEEAFHQPRIDPSVRPVICDHRIGEAAIGAIGNSLGAEVVVEAVYPKQFATVSAVQAVAPGLHCGMNLVNLPTGGMAAGGK